jgi:hypothetical protein
MIEEHAICRITAGIHTGIEGKVVQVGSDGMVQVRSAYQQLLFTHKDDLEVVHAPIVYEVVMNGPFLMDVLQVAYQDGYGFAYKVSGTTYRYRFSAYEHEQFCALMQHFIELTKVVSFRRVR